MAETQEVPIHPEIERYIDAMWMEKGLSDNTLSSYRRDLRQFNEWLSKNRGSSLLQADRSQLQAYLGARLEQGQSQRSTARFMSCARGFYHYLLREGRLTLDPTLDVDSPKLGRPLPKSLSEEDVERLLQAPDLDDALEFRDRTMLELLYACGLRVTELTSLQLVQVSLNQGVVRVLAKAARSDSCPWAKRRSIGFSVTSLVHVRICSRGSPQKLCFPAAAAVK
jgi:integrase/recombinase XerD